MLTFLLTGLILGLSSSFHCIGMCGPIALAIPLDRKSRWTILRDSLKYQFGRLVSYALLGVLVGTIGLTVETLGWLQWLSIASGIFLILWAWRKFFHAFQLLHGPKITVPKMFNRWLGKVVRSQSPAKLLFLGALNGLLPCGMVYAALLNALLTGNMFSSSIAMVAFGLGTFPAMIAVHFALGKWISQQRETFTRVLPVLLTVVGLLVVLRGMNLGIPYLSPKVSVQQTQENAPEATMDCCHSKKNCPSN